MTIQCRGHSNAGVLNAKYNLKDDFKVVVDHLNFISSLSGGIQSGGSMPFQGGNKMIVKGVKCFLFLTLRQEQTV